MFILGTSLIVSGGSKAKEDEWLSMIIAILGAIILIMIYSKLLMTFPNLGLYNILIKVYGKILGKTIILLYCGYFFHLSAICIRNITEYIQVVSFPNTPQYVAGITLVILTIYTINAGFASILAWAKKVLPFIILMILFTLLLGFPQYEFNNLKPVLYNGWMPVLKSSFSLFTFPFGETIVFMAFLGHVYQQKHSKKMYVLSILSGGVLLLAASIRNILLLGFPTLGDVFFPSHYATSLINISGYIQRIEILVSSNLILAGFIKAAVCLYAASLGLSKILKTKNIKIISPILCILSLILSILLYKSTMEMIRFIDYYKYYALVFQLVIPLITLIIASFQKIYLTKN